MPTQEPRVRAPVDVRSCKRSVDGKARDRLCASGLKEEVSVQFVELLVEGARVSVAVLADGICLRLIDVTGERSVGVEGIGDVEEVNGAVRHLFVDSLADRARSDGIHFEFQPITVPLIVGLE